MLSNRLLPFPCNSCYMPTLIARYSDNHPFNLTPPQPVLLPSPEIWKSIPLIPTITTFTNGSTTHSHNLISTNLTTHHYHHPRSYTKANISYLLLTRRHSYINRTLSSSFHSLNGAPRSINIQPGYKVTPWMPFRRMIHIHTRYYPHIWFTYTIA